MKMKTVNFNSHKQDATIDVMVLLLTTVRRVWISQYFCQRISVVRAFWSHNFSLHLFLTCVPPSQSLWISVSSGPTVKLLAFFISSFWSVYASVFITSSPSPCPSIDSKARPAGFGCFPSRALRGSSSPSVPPLVPRTLCGERPGGCRPRWSGHALRDLAQTGGAWTSLGCQSWLQKVLKIIPIIHDPKKKTNKKLLCPKLQKKLF